MQCIILAGGFGTRLVEKTNSIPKPMIKIGNMPILWHIMKIYYHQGVKEFIISCGYKAEIIKKFFLDYYNTNNDIEIFSDGNINTLSNKTEKWSIKLIDSGIDTDTGGRIKSVKKYISGKQFFVTYGDGLCNIDLKKLFNFHQKQKSLVTLTSIKNPSRFGTLKIDNRNKITSFNEKSKKNDLDNINGGYFIMNKEIIDFIKYKKTNFEKDVLPIIAKKKKLSSYHHKDFWYCMDSLRDKNYLEDLWKTSRPWKIW